MENQERKAIETLLASYEAALNASDVEKAVAVYTTDGIFMPTEGPSAIGTEQLKGSYGFVFSTIKLNIKFNIDEIVIEGNMAFARTISRGEVTILEAGITAPEENRELFVFQKENGTWKVARYMFNKMSPPQG